MDETNDQVDALTLSDDLESTIEEHFNILFDLILFEKKRRERERALVIHLIKKSSLRQKDQL